ncbi:hypothetical protein LGQ02_01940 [Bacillus shivajii]|uniref:hypothetical protein n=1 Tax=Bacillus shivajii TaxID=1983719 RepID=UPI001CFB3E4C|nr:hypothetical protein [Bacillus shivajii]UCZ53583.1 hypothetical protein LGQ02_01940 [Bacillus shivajii]
MKIHVILLIVLFVISLVFLSLINRSSDVILGRQLPEVKTAPKQELLAERFIKKHMINDDGTFKTSFINTNEMPYWAAQGDETLSESLGLWMEYALLKKDIELFHRAALTLEDEFLMKNGLIRWKVHSKEEKEVNALIDDLRIAHTLYKGWKLWNEESYLLLSEKISGAIVTHNIENHLFVDFYDGNLNQSSTNITLSYLQMDPIGHLYDRGVVPSETYERILNLLNVISPSSIFFPTSYDSATKSITFHEIVHMIDQAYLARSLKYAGIDHKLFLSFIQSEIDKGKVYGKYKRSSLKPAVHYESPAVYGLLVLYTIEAGESQLAKQLYERMKQFQIAEEDHMYYGGYIDQYTMNTHIFDNLLPLLAERRMIDATLIDCK